jgi:ATP-dependent DNA ligase
VPLGGVGAANRPRLAEMQFDPILKQVLRCLKEQRAILDGEIVVLDEKGHSNFFDLMAHRGEPRCYAFDLL